MGTYPASKPGGGVTIKAGSISASFPTVGGGIAVNKLLDREHRVALTQRERHTPTEQANEQVYRFLQWWLQPR